MFSVEKLSGLLGQVLVEGDRRLEVGFGELGRLDLSGRFYPRGLWDLGKLLRLVEDDVDPARLLVESARCQRSQHGRIQRYRLGQRSGSPKQCGRLILEGGSHPPTSTLRFSLGGRGCHRRRRADLCVLGDGLGLELFRFRFFLFESSIEPVSIVVDHAFRADFFVHDEEVAELFERLRRDCRHRPPEAEDFFQLRIYRDGVQLGRQRSEHATFRIAQERVGAKSWQVAPDLRVFRMEVDQGYLFVSPIETCDPLVRGRGVVIGEIEVLGQPGPAIIDPFRVVRASESCPCVPSPRDGKGADGKGSVPLALDEALRILDIGEPDHCFPVHDGLGESLSDRVCLGAFPAEGALPAQGYFGEGNGFALSAEQPLEIAIADDRHLLQRRTDLEGGELHLDGPPSWRKAASDDEALSSRLDVGEIGFVAHAPLHVIVMMEVSGQQLLSRVDGTRPGVGDREASFDDEGQTRCPGTRLPQ